MTTRTCPHWAYDLTSLDDGASTCPECGKNTTDAPLPGTPRSPA